MNDAQPVALAPGEEVSAHLSGHVVSSDGSLGQGHVVLGDSNHQARFREELSDGKFTFWNIRPGEHVIEKPIDDAGLPQGEYGSVSVTVFGESISDLVVATATAGTLRGHVVFDTGTPPLDLKAEDFPISAFGTENSSFAYSDLKDDWSFTLEGIASPSKIRISGRDGWFLKQVLLGGVEVEDTPLQAADDLHVVLTQKVTTVSGVVVDDIGVVVMNCSVVIFPEDRRHWTPGNRFISVTHRTDHLGRFRITELPPGRYFVAAVDGLGPRYVADADLLTPLITSASRLTLGEGESKTLNLTLPIF